MSLRTSEHNLKISKSVSATLQARQLPLIEFMTQMIDVTDGPDACHPWKGSRDPEGYGRFKRSRKSYRAHRVALELYLNRPLNPGTLVLHSCPGGGYPACCNHRHLREGNEQDNSLDALSAGRLRPAFGENHPNAVLTKKDVICIREQRSIGVHVEDIASTFKVSKSHIYNIIFRRSWKHV